MMDTDIQVNIQIAADCVIELHYDALAEFKRNNPYWPQTYTINNGVRVYDSPYGHAIGCYGGIVCDC